MAAGQLGQQLGQFGLGPLGRGAYSPSPWMGNQMPQSVDQEEMLRRLGIDPSQFQPLHGQQGLTPLSALTSAAGRFF